MSTRALKIIIFVITLMQCGFLYVGFKLIFEGEILIGSISISFNSVVIHSHINTLINK